MILSKKTSQEEVMVDGARRLVFAEYYLDRRTCKVVISELEDDGESLLDRVDDVEIDRLRKKFIDNLWPDIQKQIHKNLRYIGRGAMGGYV